MCTDSRVNSACMKVIGELELATSPGPLSYAEKRRPGNDAIPIPTLHEKQYGCVKRYRSTI